MNSASGCASSLEIPTSTNKPLPIDDTTAPPTTTDAEVTRCMITRISSSSSQCECRHTALAGVAPNQSGEFGGAVWRNEMTNIGEGRLTLTHRLT